MSLFYITSDQNIAESVIRTYKELFSDCRRILFGRSFFIYTNGFKGDEVNSLVKYLDHSSAFLIGTIFDNKLFNQEFLRRFHTSDELKDYLKNENVFGHFAIILLFENGNVEVITDRIGLINIYYATDGTNDISNDCYQMGLLRKEHIFNQQVIREYILKETNIGNDCIYANIKRLSWGDYLLWDSDNIIKEQQFYKYQIEKLDEAGFYERVKNYFGAINQYPGHITVDVSGGYDTRVVISSASRYFDNFDAFNNGGAKDRIDLELGSTVCERLGIKCKHFEPLDELLEDNSLEITAHGVSTLRDVYRSKKWPQLFAQRYYRQGLSIGGYGGEILRNKYGGYRSLKNFVLRYFGGLEARVYFEDKQYENEVYTKICKYLDKNIIESLGKGQLFNYLYAVIKMRIWGSAYIQMASLYGDVIHPYMDWYLLGPCLGFDENELNNAKLLLKIVKTDAPQLLDIPINSIGKKTDLAKRMTHKYKGNIPYYVNLYLKKSKRKVLYLKNKYDDKEIFKSQDIVTRMPFLNGLLASRYKAVLWFIDKAEHGTEVI